MKPIRYWTAMLAVAGGLWLAASAEAQQTGTAEVLLARPPAEAILRGQTIPRPVAKGARLSEGDRVRTGRSGAVEMRLGDGSLVRIGELSDFQVDRLDVDAAGAPTASRFSLTAGYARAWVARQLIAKVAAAQGAFAVETPTAVAAVRQTDFAVVQDAAAVTRVYTFEGAVETTSRVGNSVVCSRNRWTRVEPGKAPEPCGVIPLRDKRSVLKVLAFQSATVGPPDPDRVAIQSIGAKLSDEKTIGAKAFGGTQTLAPGVPAGTGRAPAATEGAVSIIITTD
ncbi:MAG: FecR domain-containing protein [Candidatus Rokubacteria bacterium]|nr:FecR domain-containing protein [Candidatus Rokubacteria bacterium]